MAGYLRSEPCVLGPYLCKGSSFRPYSCSVSLTLFLSPSYFDDLRESLETSQEIVQVQSYNSSVPGDQCMLEEKFLSAFAFSPRTCTNLCLESTVRVLPQPHRSVLNYFLIFIHFSPSGSSICRDGICTADLHTGGGCVVNCNLEFGPLSRNIGTVERKRSK